MPVSGSSMEMTDVVLDPTNTMARFSKAKAQATIKARITE